MEVTLKGKLELAAALNRDEFYIARIHSHPGAAFHSGTDNRNLVLTAEGAWSFVVPRFGAGLRKGIRECGVYKYRHGVWTQLSDAEVKAEVGVLP